MHKFLGDALSAASKHIFANAARNVRSLVIDSRVCSSAGEFDVKCDLVRGALIGRSQLRLRGVYVPKFCGRHVFRFLRAGLRRRLSDVQSINHSCDRLGEP